MESKIYLGLGSNLGDKILNLNNAVKEIFSDSNCRVIRCSSIYETTPFGFEEQEIFFNAVLEIESDYSIEKLFDFIKSIEKKLGRENNFKWGPRIIDIDILLFNQLIYSSSRITVPHSDMLKRDFVIIPLLELNDALVFPATKQKISDFVNDDLEKHIISKLESRINCGDSLA